MHQQAELATDVARSTLTKTKAQYTQEAEERYLYYEHHDPLYEITDVSPNEDTRFHDKHNRATHSSEQMLTMWLGLMPSVCAHIQDCGCTPV